MPEAAELIKGHNDAVRTFSESRVRYRTVCAVCGENSFTPIGYPLPPVEQDGNSKAPVESSQPRDARLQAMAPDSGDTKDAEDDPYHQAVIPPSLPWRFISWLGSLRWSLAKAREMILKHDPNSLCHRVSGSVDPFKARSDQRMVTLETARQLLLIIPEWEACFERPFFPQFATRAGFD